MSDTLDKTQPWILIAGLGAGSGVAMAQYYLGQGFRVVGLNRSSVNKIGHEQNSMGWQQFTVELTDESAVKQRLAAVVEKYGPPQLVIHNAQALCIANIESTSVEQFENSWRSMVLSAFVLAQSILPAMAKGACLKKGASLNDASPTFIVSGATASVRGGAKFSAFSSAKFALRGLTQSLARSYQSQGVHIVHTLLDGIIDTPESRELHRLGGERMMQPADIAKLYWQLAQQPKSTWVHELDLRPASESF